MTSDIEEVFWDFHREWEIFLERRQQRDLLALIAVPYILATPLTLSVTAAGVVKPQVFGTCLAHPPGAAIERSGHKARPQYSLGRARARAK